MTDPAKPLTICADCKHMVRTEDNGTFYGVLCGKSPYKIGIDPVTGLEVPFERDEYLRFVPRMSRFRFCRDVNDGKCALYEAKAEKKEEARSCGTQE